MTKLSSPVGLIGSDFDFELISGESLPVAKQVEPIEEEDCPVG